jgi:hypothetical protein
VAYLPEARTVEPEKPPLLVNGSETTFVSFNVRETDNGTTPVAGQQILHKQEQGAVSRQRLGKHIPAATDTHATVEVLLETVFCSQSMQSGYKECLGI